MVSKEVFKYPYCGQIIEEKVFFSDIVIDSTCKTIYVINQKPVSVISSFKTKTTTQLISVVFALAGLTGFAERVRAVPLPLAPRLAQERVMRLPYNQTTIKVAPMVVRKPDKVKLDFVPSREVLQLIYFNAHSSYINEQLLKKLRSGDMASNITVAAISVIVFMMFKLAGVDGFQIIANWNAPQPIPTPSPSSSSTQLAQIPTKAQEFNDMLLKFNEPQCQYVMTKREALELIAETYPGKVEVTANEKISDWQAVKHLYHAKGLGIDPETYGMTQKQLIEIGKPGGLVNYVRKGNKLPSIEHVKAYQKVLKNICGNSPKRTNSKYYYKHGVTPATAYYDEDNRIIVSFNQTSGDLITGDKQRENVFNRFIADNTLGGLQWIIKWGNN